MSDDTIILDAETRAEEHPADHKDELRLWLRLLTCTTMMETLVRGRLRERFDVTLPRFDLMAQLARAPDGMTLGDISRRMMVSNGNVTGLIERLVADGLVNRLPGPTDRRTVMVRLTADGTREFAAMAAEHEHWVAEGFADLSAGEIDGLMRLLARVKRSVREAGSGPYPPAT